MSLAQAPPLLDDAPRCAACGDVIGVYERVVQVVDGQAQATSRAAAPFVCGAGAICYHAGCYSRP